MMAQPQAATMSLFVIQTVLASVMLGPFGRHAPANRPIDAYGQRERSQHHRRQVTSTLRRIDATTTLIAERVPCTL